MPARRDTAPPAPAGPTRPVKALLVAADGAHVGVAAFDVPADHPTPGVLVWDRRTFVGTHANPVGLPVFREAGHWYLAGAEIDPGPVT